MVERGNRGSGNGSSTSVGSRVRVSGVMKSPREEGTCGRAHVEGDEVGWTGTGDEWGRN